MSALDLGQYDGVAHGITRRVYFDGGVSTDTIKAGYALCYKAGANTNTANRKFKERMGSVVTTPLTNNLQMFAGVALEGRVGAGPVKIVVPTKGTLVQAYTKANMTQGATFLELANNNYAMVGQSTFNAQLAVANAMETADTNTTAANIYVKFF